MNKRITFRDNALNYLLNRTEQTAYSVRGKVPSHGKTSPAGGSVSLTENRYGYRFHNCRNSYSARRIDCSRQQPWPRRPIFLNGEILTAPESRFQKYIALFARRFLDDVTSSPTTMADWKKRARRVCARINWQADPFPERLAPKTNQDIIALAQILSRRNSVERFSLLLSLINACPENIETDQTYRSERAPTGGKDGMGQTSQER